MEEEYAICRVSIAPLRAETNDHCEIVSQLLFGDAVKILEKTDKWWRTRNADDSYEGWVDFRQLKNLSKEDYTHQHIEYLAPPAVNNMVIAADGNKFYLASGSNLPNFKDGICTLSDAQFTVSFEPLAVDFDHPSTTNIKELALFYQNAPYLWGGRTLFGIDCSGFVQAVFKMAGLKLKRDASQQAQSGTTVDFLSEARTGDVAFFDNEAGKITHVGILLSNHEIIHSSGQVRIDPIDDQGIYNKELHKYTHKLRIIKRFI